MRDAKLEARRELVAEILADDGTVRYVECVCGLALVVQGAKRSLYPSGKPHVCPKPVPPAILMTEADLERHERGLAREESRAELVPPVAMREKPPAPRRESGENARERRRRTDSPAPSPRTLG